MTLQGVLKVSESGFNACAMTTMGTAYCWGNNQLGQGGNGGNTNPILVATASTLPGGAIDLAGEYYHYCVILSDGTVRCWGDDSVGEIGDNDTVAKSNKLTPTSPQW